TSADPEAKPDIAHRYLSTDHDMGLMLSGIREGAAIADVIARTTGCEVLLPDPETLADDELLKEHAGNFHGTGYHPSGSCRIGADDDEMAVVDPRLRLRGIEGLYVIDASVMPDVPRCNINLPTMMIGERGAEFVRADL
ncbi:MAG: GMC family oxidoreductase, partial [Candidatus Dormibacteraeota bacterium]|nr:GMC family oxidoreductase [Candidatus Dormibacteraeota bacterium]